MKRKKKSVVNESMKTTGSKKNGKLLLLAVLLILIAVAGITTAYRIGRQTSTESSNGIVVEENVSDWNQNLANLSQNHDSGIKIPGYGELSVGAGDTDWKITLANPKDNNCYFKYSITINDAETPIYESDYIKPGKAVTEFKVNTALDAGDYTVYMNISTYSMNGKNTRLNGASVKADLHVI